MSRDIFQSYRPCNPGMGVNENNRGYQRRRWKRWREMFDSVPGFLLVSPRNRVSVLQNFWANSSVAGTTVRQQLKSLNPLIAERGHASRREGWLASTSNSRPLCNSNPYNRRTFAESVFPFCRRIFFSLFSSLLSFVYSLSSRSVLPLVRPLGGRVLFLLIK